MSQLYILMGIPGSGKSTWVQNHLDEHTVWVSRDNVRFSMVAENEEYFSKEKQVFKKYIETINKGLEAGYDVFADATHLNKASRNKLLRAIKPGLPEKVNVIWINTPLEHCLEHNENRKETRAYVPRGVIRRMANQIEAPEFEEGINKIYIIEEGKPIKIKEEYRR